MYASLTPPATSFLCEVQFSKVDDYLDSLTALHLGSDAGPVLVFPRTCNDRNFIEAARVLSSLEAAYGESPSGLKLFCEGTNSAQRHPLHWLNVTERKRTEERRSNHEWYLCLEDGALTLTFEHGKFGYRKEVCSTWSGAFARMAELLAERCTWAQFGDEESRNTMLGKGQFYWSVPTTGEHVPVDNFVFRGADQRELKLEGVSHRCVLNVDAGDVDGSEWYDDYAEGLLRMAAVLEDRIPVESLGVTPRPEIAASLGDVARGAEASSWLTHGQFVVKSIYLYRDVHPAPVLVYKTYEGIQAELTATGPEWSLRVCNLAQEWKELPSSPRNSAEALRTLAQLLRGELLWSDIP